MTIEIKRGDNSSIDQALSAIAPNILQSSGSVFYSGRSAFSKKSDLYILGLNPGGNPVDQVSETVAADIDQFWTQPASWSAYADESWQGAAPGTWGMQPRILHMLARLKLAPREVPASNLIFVRTSSEAALRQQKAQLIRDCWPVHQAVIDSLNVTALLCFGGTAGRGFESVSARVNSSIVIAKPTIGDGLANAIKHWMAEGSLRSLIPVERTGGIRLRTRPGW
ncbi:MAG: hypothetical protein ACOY4N_00760 [Pseudomonadota bacterium]|uniref:hypothetical protein n=1 Tax=Sphingobium TaxID=165695 RepID=UPI00111D2D67|nr:MULTISPECIES: hypothetical protein [Sphingobium]QWT14109.1 hypothetical protein GTV57_16015 [Sphingobium xenophagum]